MTTKPTTEAQPLRLCNCNGYPHTETCALTKARREGAYKESPPVEAQLPPWTIECAEWIVRAQVASVSRLDESDCITQLTMPIARIIAQYEATAHTRQALDAWLQEQIDHITT